MTQVTNMKASCFEAQRLSAHVSISTKWEPRGNKLISSATANTSMLKAARCLQSVGIHRQDCDIWPFIWLYLSVCMCLLCVLLQGGQVVFHVIVRWESIAISPEESMSITSLVSLFSSTVIQTPAAPTEPFFTVANICQGCKHWHVPTGKRSIQTIQLVTQDWTASSSVLHNVLNWSVYWCFYRSSTFWEIHFFVSSLTVRQQDEHLSPVCTVTVELDEEDC